MSKLKQNYESACNEYVKAFAKKQGLVFDYWIGDEVGGIASFSCQYFFNMSDMVIDIETKQPKFLILKWHDELTICHPKTMNYKSYTMGLRFDQI